MSTRNPETFRKITKRKTADSYIRSVCDYLTTAAERELSHGVVIQDLRARSVAREMAVMILSAYPVTSDTQDRGRA